VAGVSVAPSDGISLLDHGMIAALAVVGFAFRSTGDRQIHELISAYKAGDAIQQIASRFEPDEATKPTHGVTGTEC
jgi:hypothetical protein